MSDLTKTLADEPDVIAPDGLQVRILSIGEKGSMAHFHLPAGKTGRAVMHRTVEEIWYFTEGSGAFWRDNVIGGAPMEVSPGLSLRIPVGAKFQARAGEAGLSAIAITMPPWPGEDEAVLVEGYWKPDL